MHHNVLNKIYVISYEVKTLKIKRIVFLLPAIILGFVIFFLFAGQYLVVSESPIKSDAIILLTGGGIERHEKAIALYNAGFAPMIIVSNGLEDGIYEAIIKLGVPEQHVIKETKADSTYTNALYTLQLMKGYNLKSAIVVSSDYHMRRVKFNFDMVYSSSGVSLTYCAARTSYNADYWFANQSDIQTTFNEYIKIIGNAVGLNGNEDKISLQEVNQYLFGR
jgi:uncharacterized SAM-binding protein YcdF (DUF218 family)